MLAFFASNFHPVSMYACPGRMDRLITCLYYDGFSTVSWRGFGINCAEIPIIGRINWPIQALLVDATIGLCVHYVEYGKERQRDSGSTSKTSHRIEGASHGVLQYDTPNGSAATDHVTIGGEYSNASHWENQSGVGGELRFRIVLELYL